MRADELRIRDLLQIDPDSGIIRFGNNRSLLLDAVALGLLRAQLVEAFGLTVARGLLTRLGYTHGWRTAQSLQEVIPWDSEEEWRTAGGRLHRLQGMVVFEPVPKAQRKDSRTLAEAIWKDSYEAEEHVRHLGQSEEPVCWTLAGFASGYLSYVHGEAIYCIEVDCCGKGDAHCHMIGKTERAWGSVIAPHLVYYEKDCLDAALRGVTESIKKLEKKLRARRRALSASEDWVEAGELVARSGAMRRVLLLCKKAAEVDTTVLICGESGTGKERVARYIHDQSRRAAGPFIAINCGALPDTLLESELFGHVKGAFTGASSDRPGLFEAAHRGTILLDEIGEVPPQLQVRLLRVLQEREVRRLGENRPRPIDVRVLAATNKRLTDEVDQGRFRADLAYRLRVIEIEVPPLRERPDDILPLARTKLAASALQFERRVRRLSPAAERRLLSYDWPGNVRELHNAIERAVVFAETDAVDEEDLPRLGSSGARIAHLPGGVPTGTLADIERIAILAALESTEGNKAEAARRLGIGEATLYRKLRRYRGGT